jgi:hypothetical protein
MFRAMTKESGFCVRPSRRRSGGSYSRKEGAAGGAKNINGILMALRYLSVEAEGAGLQDLAVTLKNAAVECHRQIASPPNS